MEQDLPEDQKVIIDAVNEQADKSFADSNSEDLEYQGKLAEAGVEIIPISEAKWRNWRITFAQPPGPSWRAPTEGNPGQDQGIVEIDHP